MHSVKEFEELSVGNLGGVIAYLEGFGVYWESVMVLDLLGGRAAEGGNLRPDFPEHTPW
jgi:hypothetical protein